jgi:hypothetical protein
MTKTILAVAAEWFTSPLTLVAIGLLIIASI